jgi:hypothetical protein
VHLELDRQLDPSILPAPVSKRAASMSASSLRRIAVCASESKRADLKLVGSLTCSTLIFSSGGRNACGSGLHSVIKRGSKLSQTLASVYAFLQALASTPGMRAR